VATVATRVASGRGEARAIIAGMPSPAGSAQAGARIAQLRHRIEAIADPDARRHAILGMLQPSTSWGELPVLMELALDHIDSPTDAEREALRQVVQRCSDQPARDRTCLMRVAAARLLARDPQRGDAELFRMMAATRVTVDGVDVSAQLRALALGALQRIEPDLARWAAAGLLFDDEGPNSEPHLTAVRVLAGAGDETLLLHWLDHHDGAGPVEARCEAEAELARTMPLGAWSQRATERLGDRRAVETVAAVEGLLAAGRSPIEVPLRALLLSITDADLFQAVATLLGASREASHADLLMDLVDELPLALMDPYGAAVWVSRSNRRDDVMTRINQRARTGT
jgi:hypothetical protein